MWTDWTRRCGSRRTGRRSSWRRGFTQWARAAPRTSVWEECVHGGRQHEGLRSALPEHGDPGPRPGPRSAPTSSRGSTLGTRTRETWRPSSSASAADTSRLRWISILSENIWRWYNHIYTDKDLNSSNVSPKVNVSACQLLSPSSGWICCHGHGGLAAQRCKIFLVITNIFRLRSESPALCLESWVHGFGQGGVPGAGKECSGGMQTKIKFDLVFVISTFN